jgi:hypothetical protein
VSEFADDPVGAGVVEDYGDYGDRGDSGDSGDGMPEETRDDTRDDTREMTHHG